MFNHKGEWGQGNKKIVFDRSEIGDYAGRQCWRRHDQPLFFGGETIVGNVSYVGLLDDVQIVNYPFDGVEVATMYTDIRTEATICVLPYYPMDFDKNCKVGMSDAAAFAFKCLDCNLIPVARCTE